MPARTVVVTVRAVVSAYGSARHEDSDADLLAAHAAGDRRAFEELFRRHHAKLYRVARRSSVTEQDADDALQDAMLRAHRSAGTFRHNAAVGSWLHRIVVNSCRDRLRRNAVRATVVLAEEQCTPIPDPAVRLDVALVVRQALLRLPAEQRAAVVAVDMHGYSVAEAAAVLGVAEGTVKSRCARGRARLAVLLSCLAPG